MTFTKNVCQWGKKKIHPTSVLCVNNFNPLSPQKKQSSNFSDPPHPPPMSALNDCSPSGVVFWLQFSFTGMHSWTLNPIHNWIHHIWQTKSRFLLLKQNVEYFIDCKRSIYVKLCLPLSFKTKYTNDLPLFICLFLAHDSIVQMDIWEVS